MRLIRHESGSAMVEMVLAMGVMLLIGTYIVGQQALNARDSVAKNSAESMQSLHTVAYNFAVANQEALVAATGDGTGAALLCQVNVSATDGTGGSTANNATKHTCALDADFLKFKGFLPPSFSSTARDGSRWVVVFRQPLDAAGVLTGNLESIIIAATTVSGVTVTPDTMAQNNESDALEKAAGLIGTKAGVVPSGVNQPCPWHVTDKNQQFVCGTQGAWRVKLGDFLD